MTNIHAKVAQMLSDLISFYERAPLLDTLATRAKVKVKKYARKKERNKREIGIIECDTKRGNKIAFVIRCS